MVIYYTGTGNSEYCAKQLAALTGDRCISAFEYIRGGIAGEFVSDTRWVFVSPTHGWRLPRVFEGFIRSTRFVGCRDAYFVMTCGTDTGNAAAYNRALCSEKSLAYRGTASIVMPENYVAMFPVPDEAESMEIVDRAKESIRLAADCIAGGLDLAGHPASALDRMKSGVVHAAFCRFMIGDRRFTVSGACIGCGKCERLCPVRNITMERGRPTWNGNCTHCMACICSCPASAIEYGRISVGKPRYHCPDAGDISAGSPAQQ